MGRISRAALWVAFCSGAFAQIPCPVVDFVTLRQQSLLFPRDSAGIALRRQADGSYTGLRIERRGGYRRTTETPNFQDAIANCLPPLFAPKPGAAAIAGSGGVPGSPSQFIWTVEPTSAFPYALVFAAGRGGLTATSVNPDYTIKSQSEYPLAMAGSVLGADFNGDGIADAAVVHGGGIGIALTSADGTFRAPVTIAAGAMPTSVTSGDFNGDGRTDLVVANYSTDKVTILLGNGNGTSRAPSEAATGKNPLSTAVADFNGDGRADLAVANSQSESVSILLGNGDGTFRTGVAFPATTGPKGIVAGDLNKDGRVDLAVTGRDKTVAILLGNGNGAFQAPEVYAAPYNPEYVIIADANRDGNADVLLASGSPLAFGPHEGNGNLNVLFGYGDGTFYGARIYSTGVTPAAMAIADYNGDGKPDVAVTHNFSGPSVSLLLSRESGGWQPGTDITIRSPNSSFVRGPGIAAADFNRDNRIDLAVSESSSARSASRVWILLGNGNGTFQPAVSYATGAAPQQPVAADLNGDGRIDLAIPCGQRNSVNADSTTVTILMGTGAGTFQAATALTAGTNPVAAAAADLNGDGRTDLAVVNNGLFSAASNPGGISVFFGTASGTFQAPVQYAAGINPGGVTVADVNADQRPDLVVSTNGPNFSWFAGVLLNGPNGVFQPIRLMRTDFGPADVGVADFNGDGSVDLAIAHCCGDTDMTYMLGNGDGTFQPEVHFEGGPDPSRLVVADINSDGKPDLYVLGSGSSGGGITVLVNATATSSPLSVVNGASFTAGPVAPDSIAAAFGSKLASGTLVAETNPGPTVLGGTSVKVRDSAGTERIAPLFFVSAGQVNFLVPSGTAEGPAKVTLTAPGGTAAGDAGITRVAPALFVVNSAGLVAANVLRVSGDGAQSVESVSRLEDGRVVAAEIDLGPETDQVYLVLFGTGFRSNSGPAGVEVRIGGEPAAVAYAGAQGSFSGLDQANVLLPRSLIGRGDVQVELAVDGKTAKAATVRIK